MKKILILLTLVISPLTAMAQEDLSQSPQSLAAESAKLAKFLGTKTLSCKNKKQEETLRIAAVQGDKIQVISSYGDAGDSPSEVPQLSVGELIMIYVTGPDSDEGGAVVAINTSYLSEYGEGNANAQIYPGVPGDDFYDESEALSCTLK